MTTPPAPLPDAARANWVDRFAPEALKPWLKLARLDRPVGVWLLLLPAWQGVALACAMSGQRLDFRLIALFAAGALLMRSAGCAFNDVIDRDIDAKVARTAARPIAAGQIRVRQALAFIVVCCLLSLAILLQLGLPAIILGAASLALVAVYPFMKRITWWPQAWLGLTFNWGALMGFVAVVPEDGLRLPALLLYASGVFWTLGYDTIYAIQDLEDDALIGVKSSARRLGRATPLGVAVFYALAFALAVAAGVTAGLGPSVWLFAVFGLILVWQVWRLASKTAVSAPVALSLFKLNIRAGFALFLAISIGLWR
ncbi:4-hydroxybenzoate octaprenyltransferase [Phenylobacterium immobile]|uniref:4-hydroxybenzoate octaprenyltransferase n=1 Tax=Phenylobacterium immobile TaxID=21 RepID=UPI000A52D10E|nr:4-hydroxybenzoate octaprenyltransferase [Phenylobacterium immobile]